MINEDKSPPSIESFDPWKLDQPDDGIVYLYRSFVDGFWRVINNEDMALEEATGYPVGELVDQEKMGDYDNSESGELRAIFVPPTESESESERSVTCEYCDHEIQPFNPTVKTHICRDCLKEDIQIGDRCNSDVG